MRPRSALAPLVLLVAGCPGRARTGPDLEGVAALASPLGLVCPFDAASTPFRAAWGDGHGQPVTEVREPNGWELVAGAPHLRVEWIYPSTRRPEVLVVEWLRPAGDRVVCARRTVGKSTMDLVPPQPVLVAPLATGQTWEWRGRVGEVEAASASRVLGWTDGAVTVEHRTRVGELESVQRVAWAAGRGPIAESGRMVVDEFGGATDGMEAAEITSRP